MKKLFYGIAVAAAILLAGCGQKGANAPAKQVKPAVTAVSVNKKAEKAIKDVKNSKIDMEMSIAASGQEMGINFVGQQVLKPEIQLLGTYTVNAASQKATFDMYTADNAAYLKSESQSGGQWIDASAQIGNTTKFSEMLSNSSLSSLSSSLLKKAKLTKKDGMYVVDLVLTDKDAEELTKSFVDNSNMMDFGNILDDLDLINAHFVITYDAKSYLPKESKAEIKFEVDGEAVKETVTTKFDAYNESPITKPADLPAAK